MYQMNKNITFTCNFGLQKNSAYSLAAPKARKVNTTYGDFISVCFSCSYGYPKKYNAFS